MRRGEIWLTDLEPVQGTEANKRRPAVIVSNDRANTRAAQLGRGVVTIVPVTSNVTRVFPFDRSSSLINQRGKPSTERIQAMHGRWFDHGTPVVLELGPSE